MNHSNSSTRPRRFKAVGALAAFAFAALLGAGLLAPQSAQADPRYDHHDNRGYNNHHDRYRHDDRGYRRGWGRPDVVYAPPPVVYRPEPSPGISLFLPIEIH